MKYKLKEISKSEYPNVGVVHQIIVAGPVKDYGFLYYETNQRLHQVKHVGFANNENLEATKIAYEAVRS